MKVIHGLESLSSPLDRSILTIGNFDGVHRAHQQLLAQAGLFSANTGGPVVVLTFEPHPLVIVAPDKAPARLSTLDEKLAHLRDAGADVTVVARSEPNLLGLEAERFVEKVLIEQFHPTHIVEGPSFGFGRDRRGNPELLRHEAAKFGCEVHIVDPVTLQLDEDNLVMVSSSLIRRLIVEGKVRRAGLCLGRPYTLSGTVVEGDRRGRTLGFPTANLDPKDKLVPGDSVYVGRAVTLGRTFAAAISIGVNPTFGGAQRRIEAHLLDFDEEIYGEQLRLEFVRRLRRPKKFTSPEQLVDQLRLDVEVVRAESSEGTPAIQPEEPQVK